MHNFSLPPHKPRAHTHMACSTHTRVLHLSGTLCCVHNAHTTHTFYISRISNNIYAHLSQPELFTHIIYFIMYKSVLLAKSARNWPLLRRVRAFTRTHHAAYTLTPRQAGKTLTCAPHRVRTELYDYFICAGSESTTTHIY